MRRIQVLVAFLGVMGGGGASMTGADVLYVNNGNDVYVLDSAGFSTHFSGEGGCALAYGDFGSGPRLYVGDAQTHVLDSGGVSTVFSESGGCASAFGDFGSGPRLYVNNGNDVSELDSTGEATPFSGQGGNSMAFGDFGSGPRLYVNNGSDVYALDATGSSTHLSGQGGNSMAFGDFGSGPRLYVNNGSDVYALDSTGSPTHFSSQGGNSMAFGNFGSGLRLYVNNGNDVYALDSTGSSTHVSGQGGNSMAFGADGAGTVASLLVSRAAGADLELSWGASCAGANDYAVYEGALGVFDSHTPLLCSTGGGLTSTITPGPGNRYYLVVPQNTIVEGSYGTSSAGVQRPPGAPACRVSQAFACSQP